MKDADKTKERLINELEELRHRVAELETAGIERRSAEEALRESEVRYHTLFAAANDAIMILSKEDGVAVDCNPAALKLFGCDREHIVGYPPEERLCPMLQPDGRDSREKAFEQIELALEGKSQFIEWRNTRYDGTPFDSEVSLNRIDLSGEVFLQVIMRDITDRKKAETELKKYRDHLNDLVRMRTEELAKTNDQLRREIEERKQAEESLRESEKQYRVLAENVADGVALFQDGRFLFTNNAFAAIFGYTNHQDQLLDIEPADLISDDFKQEFMKMYGEFESSVSNERIFQTECLKKDGRKFWTEWQNNVIKWKGKQAVLATARDITESKLNEIAIKEESDKLRRENIKLRATIKDRYKFGDIIGKSPVMVKVYELILKGSASDANMIIYGETGTGKELVAQTIHNMSGRSDKPFVTVNCGAIPESLFESEFFGHRKGAFTGAHMDKQGFFDLAHGGSLFLDEAGELTLNMQVKLLRVIEDGSYMPVGGDKTRKADVRIIAATNRNLADQVKKGLMREDFFYRIHVIPISVPSLRDRKEDIPLLADHFLKLYGNVKNRLTIPGKIMDSLFNYHWPGNVRELQNVLHRYITLNSLDLVSPLGQRKDDIEASIKEFDGESLDFRTTVQNFEKSLIIKALEKNQWHKGRTASMLGLPRRTFTRKLQYNGLQ